MARFTPPGIKAAQQMLQTRQLCGAAIAFGAAHPKQKRRRCSPHSTTLTRIHTSFANHRLPKKQNRQSCPPVSAACRRFAMAVLTAISFQSSAMIRLRATTLLPNPENCNARLGAMATCSRSHSQSSMRGMLSFNANGKSKTRSGGTSGGNVAEQSVQPEPRAARFLKSALVGRGPVNRGVLCRNRRVCYVTIYRSHNQTRILNSQTT